MKKSQIFLGTSAFVLALVGAVASRASRKLPIFTAATKGVQGNLCSNKQQIQGTTINSGGQLNKAHTANGGHTFYTARKLNGATVCGKTLYTATE